ncbi:MAG: hypothetical protein PVI26_00305 [Chitinispirillia bacterium]
MCVGWQFPHIFKESQYFGGLVVWEKESTLCRHEFCRSLEYLEERGTVVVGRTSPVVIC